MQAGIKPGQQPTFGGRNEMERYLFQYHWNGSTYGIDIVADSQEEAEARMKAAGGAHYLGVCHGRIPAAIPGAGMLVRLICWWKNLRVRG